MINKALQPIFLFLSILIFLCEAHKHTHTQFIDSQVLMILALYVPKTDFHKSY